MFAPDSRILAMSSIEWWSISGMYSTQSGLAAMMSSTLMGGDDARSLVPRRVHRRPCDLVVGVHPHAHKIEQWVLNDVA